MTEHYFFQNLPNVRKKRNITQTEMADMLQKSSASINAYEKEGGNPPLEVLVKMVRILDVNMHDLFFTKNYDPTETAPSVAAEPEEQYQSLRDDLVAFKAQVKRDIEDFKSEILAELGRIKQAG